MNTEELQQIFDETEMGYEVDNIFQALMIIRKYTPEGKSVICGAEHDVLYSVDAENICKAGLTKEDAIALRVLGCMIDEDAGDCLSFFA